MIGETILAGTLARYKQTNNWCDTISLIIGLQSASRWSVNIYCTNNWPSIGAPIIVPPILAWSSAASFNSANPTWVILNPDHTAIRNNLVNFFSIVSRLPNQLIKSNSSIILHNSSLAWYDVETTKIKMDMEATQVINVAIEVSEKCIYPTSIKQGMKLRVVL